MNCPKCEDTELTAVSMPVKDTSRTGAPTIALEIDQCPSCGGIWFDPGELEKYLGAKIKPLSVPKTTAKTALQLDAETGGCPRCAVPLEHRPDHYNPGVTIDLCGKCGGTWVDGDELARAGGGELPFSERMKALFGDVRPGAA
jgi:Zn-finger nucleic acid-binding protein